MQDYRDPHWFGQLDDVLREFETPLWLYRVTGKRIMADGSTHMTKKKYKIYGSLQTWRKTKNYSEDGVHTSSRAGKLLVRYSYKIQEDDIIQKNNEFYKVVGDANDFDYAGVHDFAVERIGLAEIHDYKFDEFLEEEFE